MPTKVCLVKPMGFFPSCHVSVWQLDHKEGWMPEIDVFELWCLKRLSRVPWTARTSNQSILQEISPGYSLEGLMLKLKLQYFGHLMQRADSLGKTLLLGNIEGRRRRDDWMVSLTQWTWVWARSGRWRRTGKTGAAVHGVTESQTQLSDWTMTTTNILEYYEHPGCCLALK